MSRPSIYSPEIAEAIFERLEQGEALINICRDQGMPGVRTALRWAAENESFGTEYARAREAQAEHMDGMILDVAAKAGEDPQAARVKIDAYKWRAAKLYPKKFGDATMLKHADAKGEKLELGEVERATRLASILGEIEKRRASDDAD